MNIYYLSDGEQSGLMDFAQLQHTLRETCKDGEPDLMPYHTVEALLHDMEGALDTQGFWHGILGVYNVAIVAATKIEELNHA